MYNRGILILGIITVLLSASLMTSIPLVNGDSGVWTITRLTNNSVYDVDVHISADGSKIVFVEDLDENSLTDNDWEIMLIDLDTMHIQRLTNNMYPDYYPSISEDGSKIVFLESRGDDRFICSVNSDGTGFRVLSSDGGTPYITPDGSKIVYAHGNGDYSYIKMMNSDGTNARRVTSGDHVEYPVITNRDGSKIAFCRNDNTVALYTVNSDGTNLRFISNTPWLSAMKMSDDGSKIVYAKVTYENGKGYSNAAMYDTHSGTETLLGTRNSGSPAISGDGSQIAYFYADDSEKEYIKIVDGEEVYVGKQDETYTLYFLTNALSINRDGSKIAFMSWKDGNTPEIYLAAKEKISLPSDSSMTFVPFFDYQYTTIIFGSEESPLSTVTIPITIKKADNIGSMNLALTYNSAILQATDVIPGALTQDAIIETNLDADGIRIGLIDTNGISGDGTLFYVKFNVTAVSSADNESTNKSPPVSSVFDNKKFTLGGSGILNTPSFHEISEKETNYSPLNIKSVFVSDLTGNKITAMAVNGTFTVGAKKGDVNGDGDITSVDALMALKMSVNELEVNLVADMDDDGQVLANDALQIMNIAAQHGLQHAASMLGTIGFEDVISFGGD